MAFSQDDLFADGTDNLQAWQPYSPSYDNEASLIRAGPYVCSSKEPFYVSSAANTKSRRTRILTRNHPRWAATHPGKDPMRTTYACCSSGSTPLRLDGMSQLTGILGTIPSGVSLLGPCESNPEYLAVLRLCSVGMFWGREIVLFF